MFHKLGFNVSFRGDVCEADCTCQLFIFKGILCRHALTIFIRHEVDLLPDKYILRRWRKDVRRAHSKMKVKFNSWENTAAELRYPELCLAFSEVADLAVPISHEYDEVKIWIENKFNSLQLNESSVKGKEIPKTRQFMEEEKKDEEDGCKNILDPLSQTRKGRPKKNRLKPSSRRSKHKSNQSINPSQIQVGVGNATQESFVSNLFVLQPNMVQPWRVYHSPQLQASQFQMPGQLHAMGAAPMYGYHLFPGSYIPSQYPGPSN